MNSIVIPCKNSRTCGANRYALIHAPGLLLRKHLVLVIRRRAVANLAKGANTYIIAISRGFSRRIIEEFTAVASAAKLV